MTEIGPVFVAGCPRSGTSALSWALAAHPGYWTSVETHFFYNLLRDHWLDDLYARSSRPGSWLDAHEVGADEFLGYAGLGFDRMMRARSGGRHWVDGSPENLMVARPLLRMFDQARLFHVVRDPRAVCYSMLTSGFSENWASDIGEAIQTWKHYVSTGLSLMEDFPDRVIWIRQEDMRANPASVAGRIGTSLALEDVGPIAAFLKQETINSSADKSTYVEGSPFQEPGTQVLGPAEFQTLLGERIRDETGPLAARCGYTWR